MVATATKQPTFRMTLLLWFCGAHPRVVMAEFVLRALAAGLAGLVIGVVLAMMLTRTLESLLYGVRTRDAASVTVAAVLLLVVTAVAAWVPALRVTHVDAVHVLRR